MKIPIFIVLAALAAAQVKPSLTGRLVLNTPNGPPVKEIGIRADGANRTESGLDGFQLCPSLHPP